MWSDRGLDHIHDERYLARNRYMKEVQHILQNIGQRKSRRNNLTGNPTFEQAHSHAVKSDPQRHPSHIYLENNHRTRCDTSSHWQSLYNESWDR